MSASPSSLLYFLSEDAHLTYRLQVNVLPIEALLPPQHGMIEHLKVLRCIGVAEEPVESRPDEQRAEERPLRVVGFREEQLLRPGESLGIELLQGWVGGDQRILQSPGPEAELLSVLALQHCGGTHRLRHCLQEGMHQHMAGTWKPFHPLLSQQFGPRSQL